MTMKTIAAAKFKEQCLSILDRLGPEGVLVTKRGRPVARVLPVNRGPVELIGCLKDHVQIKGEIMSTGVKWKAHD